MQLGCWCYDHSSNRAIHVTTGDWENMQFKLSSYFLLPYSLCLIILTSFTILSISTAFETGSNHIVALIGERTTVLSCRTFLDFSVAMYLKYPDNGIEVEICDRHALINGFASEYTMITRLPREYTLEINSTRTNHAGLYSCYDNEGIGQLLSSAELTVVGTKRLIRFISFHFITNISPGKLIYTANAQM